MTGVGPDLLVLAGGLVVLVAALGLHRMPDVFCRIHAATKAPTLAVGLVLLAVVVRFPRTDVVARAGAVQGFLFLTLPVAAHLVGRAAHRAGVATTPETRVDELREAREGERDRSPD